jgi:hypothetical protein
MSDYADLMKRLRGKKLNCNCAAKSASECCCNTDWPESSCNEAADAIEALEAKLRGTEWVWKEAKEQHRLCWESFEALEAENEKLRAAFRVNMLRAFSNMSHEEIDAEIAAAIRESVDE